VLEPLGLVLKAGVWYLVADVPDDDRGPRTYRLSRMRAAVPLEETFDRRAGFDLQQHWTAYQHDYEQRIFHGAATIRLSPDGRQLLFLIGSVAARAGHQAMTPPDEDGWTVTTVPIESIKHAQHALMQLGADVEVLAPAELRVAVTESASAMVRRYGASAVGGDAAASAAGSAAASTSAG
jgi:predicted DNA-binding transcriptional regulator YafY